MIRELFGDRGRRFDPIFWRKMDLLERHLPAEVKAIVAATTDEAAYEMLAPLRNAVQECQSLNPHQKRDLDLMLIGITQLWCVGTTPAGQVSGMEQQRIPQLKML